MTQSLRPGVWPCARMPNTYYGRVALPKCFCLSTKIGWRGEVGLKSTIPWSSLSGGQAIPAAIFGLRSVGVLFASGLLRIASVQRLFLNVIVNIISSQVTCGLTGNCCEQSYTSTIPNRSQKAQMIEWRAIQTGGGKKCGWWTWYKCS